jgi:hypothetical protein
MLFLDLVCLTVALAFEVARVQRLQDVALQVQRLEVGYAVEGVGGNHVDLVLGDPQSSDARQTDKRAGGQHLPHKRDQVKHPPIYAQQPTQSCYVHEKSFGCRHFKGLTLES